MVQCAREGVFLQICNMAQTVRGEFLNANFVGYNWPLRGTICLAE